MLGFNPSSEKITDRASFFIKNYILLRSCVIKKIRSELDSLLTMIKINVKSRFVIYFPQDKYINFFEIRRLNNKNSVFWKLYLILRACYNLVNTRLTDKVECRGAEGVPPVVAKPTVRSKAASILVTFRVASIPLRVGLIKDKARASPREVKDWRATIRSHSQPVVRISPKIYGEKILVIWSVKNVDPIKSSVSQSFDFFERNTEFKSPNANYFDGIQTTRFIIWTYKLQILT